MADKTDIEEKFDYLVSKIIWPQFKKLGYKKSGYNFRYYNNIEGCGKIVNFQKSTYYNKFHIHFTINTGLFIDNPHLNFGKSLGDKFTEPCCVVRNRIGDLMNTNDIWYDITESTDIDQLQKAIEDAFDNFIMPYLAKYNATADIVHSFLTKPRFSVREIEYLFHSGYKKEAKTILDREISGSKNEHHLNSLLQVKKEFENIE